MARRDVRLQAKRATLGSPAARVQCLNGRLEANAKWYKMPPPPRPDLPVQLFPSVPLSQSHLVRFVTPTVCKHSPSGVASLPPAS
jgi:hypothetical protein